MKRFLLCCIGDREPLFVQLCIDILPCRSEDEDALMFHVLLGHYWRGSRLGFNTTNAQEPWREPQTAVTRFQRRPQPARSATSASTNWSFGRADGPPNTHAPTPPRLMRVLTPRTNCPSTGVRQTRVGKDATSPCAQPVAARRKPPGSSTPAITTYCGAACWAAGGSAQLTRSSTPHPSANAKRAELLAAYPVRPARSGAGVRMGVRQ